MDQWLPKMRTVVPLLFLLCQVPPALAEEPEDFEELDLEELLDVVYTASKHKQNISESPSAITVIPREQIENTWCTDLVCLLRQVPEMDVLRIRPMHTAVGARAFTDEMGEKVLVQIDGMEINSETFGSVLWQALPIHLEDIERIEVIRGPGSALYGANAHSAVVSIITRKKSEHLAEVFAGSGELGRHSLHGRLAYQLGNWRLRLTGGGDMADSWREREVREREVGRLWLWVDRQGDLSETSIHLGLTQADGHIYHVLGPAQLRNTTIVDAVIRHQFDFIQGQLSFNLMKGIIPINPTGKGKEDFIYQGLKLGELPPDVPFINPTLDADVQLTWSFFEGNLLIAGGNYRWIALFSDETLPGEVHQHRVGAFIHDEQLVTENLILTGSVRIDYNSITPFTFSPRLAGVYGIAENHFVRLAFGQAFRKPSFFNSSIHIKNVEAEPAFPEFVEFFQQVLGNQDIGNEEITSFETGYLARFPDAGLTLEADAFYNRYRNTITLNVDIQMRMGVPDLMNSSAHYTNSGREVDSLGGSVSLTWRFLRAFRLAANYTYRYSFYASDPGGITSVEGGEKGERVPWEPAHLANLSFHYLPESGIRLGVGGHFTSSRTGYVSKRSAFDPREPIFHPESWFLSAFISWRLGPVEVGIRAFNLMDMRFRDLPGMVRPQGDELGGEEIRRRIFLFVRGAI
jgi:outer membrane receptor for ferrienterochelin and colicin